MRLAHSKETLVKGKPIRSNKNSNRSIVVKDRKALQRGGKVGRKNEGTRSSRSVLFENFTRAY